MVNKFEGFELTDDMKSAYESIKSKQHTVILGAAGSGKSTFISYLIDNGLNLIKVAPTGVAAASIRGNTIHRFFGLPPRIIEPSKALKLRYEKEELVYRADAILIDEISMVRADLMDGISAVLSKTVMNDEPFGGIPIIMMGDLGQLPPIVRSGAESDFFNFNYKSEFFFDSNAFKSVEQDGAVNFINFSKVFRQTDEKFIGILNKIRFGKITNSEIDSLNESCYLNRKENQIILCSRNDQVEMVNNFNLMSNDNELEEYVADITGNFNIKNSIGEYRLKIKVGTKVMILVNGSGYFNGSLGVYMGMEINQDIGTQRMKIKLDDGGTIVLVEKYKFEEVVQEYDRESNKIVEKAVNSMLQYPIKLAYALSIHKSQSLSFDNMSVDVGKYGSFSHGQTYVALSRCRTLEGLNLVRKLKPKDIIFDRRIKEWMNQYNLIL